MTLKNDAFAGTEIGKATRRPWTAPRARRLATSEAQNSSGLGPDLETVAS